MTKKNQMREVLKPARRRMLGATRPAHLKIFIIVGDEFWF